MTTKQPNKFIRFQKNHPVLNTTLFSLVSIFIGYVGTYIIDIKPSIDVIKTNNNKILMKQDSSVQILRAINEKYTKSCEDGEDIKVGYSSEAKEDLIKIIKHDNLILERGDEIYLSNNIGKYKPSIRLMVEEIIDVTPKKNTNNEVKIYISKEAVDKLGLDKTKGIFTLKMKRVIK